MAVTATGITDRDLPAVCIGTVALWALGERVFDLLDNPAVLGAHMEEPSVKMMGASMTHKIDNAEGRAVGSVVKMTGLILGGRSTCRKS
jgi:hypothetical protein